MAVDMDDSGGASKPGRPPWSFRQWHAAGFTRLVSILPIDANGGPKASQAFKDARGKAPGRIDAGSGQWRLYDRWQHAVHSATDYERWDGYLVPEYRAGIGVVLGDVIALDIDVLEPEMVRHLRLLAETHFGAGAWRVGQQPKCAMLLRLKGGAMPFRKRRLTLTPPGWKPPEGARDKSSPHKVEVLARGQQIVVDGIHPRTKQPYMWSGGHPAQSGIASLRAVDLEEIDAFLAEVAKLSLAKGWIPGQVSGDGNEAGMHQRSPEELACPPQWWPMMLAGLRKLPNPADCDRDHYVMVAFAIRGAAGTRILDGFEAWEDWASRWQGGTNEPGEILARWNGVRPSRVGWEWIVTALHAAGISELYTAVQTDAFAQAAQARAEGEAPGREQEQARANAAQAEAGIDISPFWGTLTGPFAPTQLRINDALQLAGGASPSDPDEAYLRIRMAMAWFGRITWLGATWVEYNAATGVWAPVEEGQLELRVEGFIREWLDRHVEQGRRVAFAKRFLDKLAPRAPRLRPLMRLGSDTDSPIDLMEQASAALIALKATPGSPPRCIVWGTGEERPITRSDCILSALPEHPAEALDWAKAPAFKQLLTGLLGAWDEEVAMAPPQWRWLQAWCGYSLAGCRPARSEQRALVLRGIGQDGKGTLFKALKTVLGDYVGELSIEQLVRGVTTHANDEIAPQLRGKRLLFVAEASGSGMVWRDALVKSLIANEEIRGRNMGKDGVRATSRAVLWLAGNVMPRWQHHDRSVRRRFWWIHCEGVLESEVDVNFWERVRAERAFILRWVLDGIRLWRDGALRDPAMRGIVVTEDRDGSASDDHTAFYEGAITPRKAFGMAISAWLQPLPGGMMKGAALAKEEDLQWLGCVPVSQAFVLAAAQMHALRMGGQLSFGPLNWERNRASASNALRDTPTDDARAVPYSRRFSRARRRYMLGTWRDASDPALISLVDTFLRYVLGRAPSEFAGFGRIPASMPGMTPDVLRALMARGMIGDEE